MKENAAVNSAGVAFPLNIAVAQYSELVVVEKSATESVLFKGNVAANSAGVMLRLNSVMAQELVEVEA